MRLNRGTLIFVVVLAVVIVAAALLLRGDDATDTPVVSGNTTPTAEPQALYPDLTTDAVTALSINRRVNESDATVTVATELAATSLNLVYTNETWSLANPDASGETREIEQTRVEQAISTLLGLRSRESFETDNLAQFGLEEPAYDVNFTAGDTNYRLQVGNKNPGGTQYYALVGDGGNVYLLTSSASVDTVLNLLNPLPYVVPPTPTPVPVLQAPGPVFVGLTAASINSFSLTDTTTGRELVLVRDPETLEWTMPGSDEAVLQQLVDFVIQEFTALTTIDKVPGTNLATLGLENPSRLIVAGINENENHVIAIGNADPTGTRYYARINAYEDVAVLPAERIAFIFDMLDTPPINPEVTGEATEVVEATAEMTAEAVGEATAEATGEATPEMTEAVVEVTVEATEVAAASTYPLVFADVTADSVTEVTISQVTEASAEPVVVSLAADADSNWTDIIETLLSLDVRGSFERDDVAPFGLDAPAVQITLTAGDENYALQLGKRSTGGTAYALVGDDGQVYVIGSAAQVRALFDLLATLP